MYELLVYEVAIDALYSSCGNEKVKYAPKSNGTESNRKQHLIVLAAKILKHRAE